MKTLFVVKMTRKETGSDGYHSVWTTKEAAERQARLRNQYHPDYDYVVHEVTNFKAYRDWWNRNQVSFIDSAGLLVVY